MFDRLNRKAAIQSNFSSFHNSFVEKHGNPGTNTRRVLLFHGYDLIDVVQNVYIACCVPCIGIHM